MSDQQSAPPDFADNENLLAVCNVFFDDEESGPTAIKDDDAQTIADFLRQWESADVDLYFHCGAGVSRSAGLAAAAMLAFFGDDNDIFGDGFYCPNMRCYRSLLNALDITYDDIQVAAKERQQFLLWQEEHAEDLNI